jgi:hypothetical protein
MTEQDYIEAHHHCTNNREELFASDVCGCFYCLNIYNPAEITDWIDGGKTAICAHCPVDSVIAAKSGYPITKEFLQQMFDRWFGEAYSMEEVREQLRK